MKKIVCLALMWILPLTFLVAQDSEKEGDEKIWETIKRIEEEAAQIEEEEAQEGSDEEGNPLLELFWKIFYELFLQYSLSIRFADYPYADRGDFYFATSTFMSPGATKALSLLGLATDLAYHFDGTYGNSSRVSAQLTALHANFFNQIIFARARSLSAASFNGGLSLVLPKFLLNCYAGSISSMSLTAACSHSGSAPNFSWRGGCTWTSTT